MSEKSIELLRETLGGRYEPQEVLGRGGMAIVYSAKDLRHNRSVAIKILDPSLGSRLGAERFLREVRAVAGMSHPNILPLYDSGEAGGLLYYIMPRVDGETLALCIERQGQLSVLEAVRIGRELADALAYAHARGVVHRDVKPSNVLVLGGGHVCLADFGLVRDINAEEGRLTSTGMMIGSPYYVSPEQIEGSKPVEGRSDVYSLGCVLFEMMAGRPPFHAADIQGVLWRHLLDSPPPLRTLRSEVPEVVEELVAEALVKAPADRPDAATMLSRLGEIQTRIEAGNAPRGYAVRTPQSIEGEQKSLAVLPFSDLSPGGDQAYFSQGLAEEITAGLSRIQALRVISRTSAQAVNVAGKSVRSIGRELGVRYLVEGSVRKSGTRLRIVLRLVDAALENQLWSQQYSGSLEEIFEFQEQMARDVVSVLRVRLESQESELLRQRPIENVHAYECYLQARHDMMSWTEEPLRRAMLTLKRGMEIIGENPLLLAGEGFTHLQFVNAGIGVPDSHLEEATRCAEQIVRQAPDSPYGHSLNGMLATLRNDLPGAVRSFRRALALDPNDPNTLATLCLTYGAVGRGEAAMPLVRQLLQIDPLTPLNYWIEGWVFWTSGRPDLAVEPIRKMRRLQPGDPAHALVYANVLAHEGETDEALSVLDELLAEMPPSPLRSSAEFMMHAVRGSLSGAEAALAGSFADYVRGAWFDSWVVASFFGHLGAKKQALEWLRNAVDSGFINFPFLSTYDPFLAGLRGEREFRELMETVKRKWKEFNGGSDSGLHFIEGLPTTG